MKIALVITNLRGGGAEKALLKLAAALSARGHEVHLILLEHLVEHTVDASIRLHALSAPGRPAPKGYFGKRLTARRLRALHRRLGRGAPFELTVSTLPYADEVTALARLPGVWHRIANTLSSEIAALERSHPRKAARRLARYRHLYRGRDLIAVSDGVAGDLRDGIGLHDANIVRIYNPFDFAAIRAAAQAAEAELPAGPYVLHVGRYAPQKRHDLLVAAFRSLPDDYRLVLLTRPDPALQRLLEQNGLAQRALVAGFRPNPYPWIARAALLVLCSDHEGLPNVLIEALACGTPLVSTDCPSGPREILAGDLARFLVPCNDAAALARAMREALAAPREGFAADLGRYSLEAVVAQYEALPQMQREAA